jgi:phosphodiesterase/alkaline phosphatase D-like protein
MRSKTPKMRVKTPMRVRTPVVRMRRMVAARRRGWLAMVFAGVAVGVLGVFASSALAAPETPAGREATSIGATSAVLHGELNPGAAGEVGHYDFTYQQSSGECAAGFTAPASPAAAAGGVEEAVEVTVSNLEPDREYTFCVVAINESSEPATSLPVTFKTLAVGPEVVGTSVSGVSPFGARMEAMVNPENETTSCVFEYGTTLAYGSEMACQPPTLAGFGGQGVGVSLAFLEPGTTYHFRVVVQSASGSNNGTGEFTTVALSSPTVESESVASVNATGAVLQAQVDPGGQTTTYQLEYSTKESGKVLQAPVTTVKGTSHLLAAGGVQTAVVSTGPVLAAGSTYYYRVVAVNATPPAADGVVQSFTTVPAATTDTPSSVTATSATFNGTLSPLNPEIAAQYSFIYNFGGECAGAFATQTEEAGTGAGGELAETANVTELQPNVAYTVCFVTSNMFGSQEGTSVHFTTLKAPPKIESESVVALDPFEAALEAQVNPNNEATSYKLEYSNSESGGVLQPPVTTVKGTVPFPASYGAQQALVTTPATLTPGETYYYQFVAENGTPPATEGTLNNFTTPAALAPVIEAENATPLTPASEALEAQINTGYQATGYSFQYDEEESVLRAGLGTTLPGGTLPTGSVFVASQHVSVPLTGLQPDRTYYYRVVASNATGPAPTLVNVAHFTTSNAPSVSTGPASAITPTSVTLTGGVNPDGLPTSYYFQYGGTNTYGHQTTIGQAGESTSTAMHAIPLSGLEPGRSYHYRIVASNDNGQQTSYGQDETFATPPAPPTLGGLAVTTITQTTATITATLNPQGLPTHYELQVGPTPALLALQTSGNTNSTTPVTLTLTTGALAPGSVYHYKLAATNPDGATEPEGTFTTNPPSTPTPQAAPPPIVPYNTIAQLNEKEAKEHKPTKPPTRHEQLQKALKHCKTIKNKHKRATCQKQAHHKYAPTHTK